ncbi:cytochrome P450 [Xylaria sp. CBS 124048]|nr:cytochrome P450 [Xylaria sp. CBS 124048]
MDILDISSFSLSTAILVLAPILTLGYLFAQYAYPRPFPGVPYNQAATKNLFGDVPEIAEFERNGGTFRSWFLTQAARHNSAITQVFLGPLSKPALVVSDYREVNDILSHRDAVDFKRGLKVDAFRGLLPHAFPAMETFDPRFRASRDLARDLMTPSILYGINAPCIHDVTCHILELWRLKSRLAAGRPFNLATDILQFSFDAIVSAAIGLENGVGDIKRNYEELSRHSHEYKLTDDPSLESDVKFRRAPESAKLAALRVEENSLRLGFMLPWPNAFYRINNLRPSVRAASRTLRDYIASQIDVAMRALSAGPVEPKCALDFVIQREVQAAGKEERPPSLADPRILEPIKGYLIAGHDTSSGSLLWLMRRLVDHPEAQTRLRDSLRATYDAAWRERRLPTVQELLKQHCAYLDAFIEETMRVDTPVPNIMVMTRRETVILGVSVPAETRVFVNLAGASLNQNSVPVDESLRSAYTRPAVARETWDGTAPEEFRPERWLKEDARGEEVFDAAAGPALAFSAGNRGCWGKRLGYLELRFTMALWVWSFEFVKAPKLTNWEDTVDSLVTAPKNCIVQVKEILYE